MRFSRKRPASKASTRRPSAGSSGRLTSTNTNAARRRPESRSRHAPSDATGECRSRISSMDRSTVDCGLVQYRARKQAAHHATDRLLTRAVLYQSAIRNPQSKMLAKRIIPCLDVDRGRVVKGISFVNLVDAGDPVEQGARYDGEGADELVFLDITASSDRREIVADMVRRVADRVFIPFTVGGGVRTVDDIRAILKAGADKISVNTAAVQNPDLIREGAERF